MWKAAEGFCTVQMEMEATSASTGSTGYSTSATITTSTTATTSSLVSTSAYMGLENSTQTYPSSISFFAEDYHKIIYVSGESTRFNA